MYRLPAKHTHTQRNNKLTDWFCSGAFKLKISQNTNLLENRTSKSGHFSMVRCADNPQNTHTNNKLTLNEFVPEFLA